MEMDQIIRFCDNFQKTIIEPMIKKCLTDLAFQVKQDVYTNFVEQRTPDGVPWEPSLRVIKNGGMTLILSGLMMQKALESFDNPKFEYASGKAQFSVLMYVDMDAPPYAHIHQEGGYSENLNAYIPQREFYGIDEETYSDFEGIFDQSMQEFLKEKGI